MSRSVCLCIFAALALSGCQTIKSREAPMLTPIAAPAFQETKPVAFRKVVLGLPSHTPIGIRKLGVLCVDGGSITPADLRFDAQPTRFSRIFRTELARANYRVVGDPNALFSDPELSKAEYFVAGLITEIEFNICYPEVIYRDFRTTSAASYLKIEWQVFDPLRREVVRKITTTGSAEIGPQASGADLALDGAFAAATRNLLAAGDFYELVRGTAGGATVAAKASPAGERLRGVPLRYDARPGLNNQYLQSNVAVVRTAGGHGSGFLLSPDFLITNQHVVGKAARVRLLFVDGTEADGTVVSTNAIRDLALISVRNGNGRGASIASEAPGIGQTVYSYGAPLREELSGTLRQGVVSGIREDRGLKFIQSDAAVNPGNSGGPLLDAQGNVVGVAVSGLMIGTLVEQGINYFIPIQDAIRAFGGATPADPPAARASREGKG